jgi:hypothetical protein
MILMSPVGGLAQSSPVTTSYDPARRDLGVSSEPPAGSRGGSRRRRSAEPLAPGNQKKARDPNAR